ncbi:hypothetical protein GO730_17070 [Spirosoma sp. HMF3257]|uniref:Uncharacterized protein n=1 Tax=Spirosoma telluris TaxID=2183553 RepID=A0A327NNL5_9BACT|nr:hypothetical protein [Spirosoma telluris]RAI75444.1 hypothetical protein HMF3257_17000 [Spirosoma telluris]
MPTLTQLTAIDQHLRKENWLLNEDLITELTDHYINGIDERLAQGMAFDVAIREIHSGFGGRKGLLKMEEDYQLSQTKNNGRIIREKIALYFRKPQLSITILILVYTSIRVLPDMFLNWGDSWIFISLLGGMSVLYMLALIHLINNWKQTNKTKAVSQELRVFLQVIFSAISLCFYIHIWMPVEQVIIRYPLPSSIIITLFIIIELATCELLFDQLQKKSIAKPA